VILAGAAVAFVAGVVFGAAIGVPGWILVVMAALLLAGAWLCRRWRFWSVALLGAALCLGFWRAPHASPPTPGDLRFYNGRQVQLNGTVSAEPDLRDTGANYEIAVDTLQTGLQPRHVTGGLYVHTSSAVHLEYGDRVSLQGRLVGTGTGGFTATLARRGIYSELRFPRLADLGPSPSVSWFTAELMHLRQRLENGIDAWLPEPEAALLIAITLGARSSELGDLAPILVTTGLIHLIAISGIKVALVAGMIQQAFRSFAGRVSSLLAATGALWLYVLLISAVGTFAIVAFSVPAGRMIPSIPFPQRFSRGDVDAPSPGIHILPSPFREALTVTVAAQLGTLPIAVIGFHLLSATGPLANAIVLPFLPLVILLGFALGALSGVSFLAAPVATLAYALLHAAVRVATTLAHLGVPPLSSVSPAETAIYYALLAGLAWVLLRRLQWVPEMPFASRARELGIAGVVSLGLVSVSLAGASGVCATSLTWLGTGNAMLLQSGGMSALIDGSNHPFALLERLGSLLPYRSRSIDLIVVTDPRSGNVSGLQAVLQHYVVGEVLDVGAEYPTGTYASWRADLRARHIPVYALRTGASVTLGASSLTTLGPDAVYPKPQDSAGLVRIKLPHRTVLLATGADRREEHEAVFRGVALHADTAVVGPRSDSAFLQAVGERRRLSARLLGSVASALYP
jgi:competence protein ComEC